MASNRQKLNVAANILSKYYGLPVLKDLLSTAALDNITGNERLTNTETNKLLQTIMANFINSSSGALTSNMLIQRLNQLIEIESVESEMLNKAIQIYFTDSPDQLIKGTTTNIDDAENLQDFRVSIKKMMNYEGDNGINETPANPSKESPTMSIILSNSDRVGLVHRDTNAVTIFLNGIPNIEMGRAVPFLNVEFLFPRPPLGTGSQIQNLSMAKFLLGAEKVDDHGSALGIMVNGDQVSPPVGAKNPEEDNYSRAGMELFCSPQTLVNANLQDNPALHSTPILDKFRPLMSLQGIDINVVPSKGLMSFKTADLKFILHDRSRLADVADFVRADLYGKTEIQVEYGWSHPDGNSNIGTSNPYGDLINGMRVKEKYQVINSSFTFDDNGQVLITLKMAMKGAVDFDTELISSDSESLNNTIKDIEELQKLVGEYKDRIFSNSQRVKIKEIRGIQILDAAQDAISQVTAGKKLRAEMVKFRRSMKKTANPDAKALISVLDNLFQSDEGEINKLKRKILDSVKNKMKKLEPSGSDPFLILPPADKKSSSKGARNVKKAIGRTARQEREYVKEVRRATGGIKTGGFVSLSKILLNFVAEPLARTQKYDDIQFVFYPFNDYAGAARSINIANFAVNLGFFTEEFAKYRLEHVSKSGNMNLREFLSFLSDVVLDDPAARSYGLFDKKGSFYKTVFNEDGSQRTTEIADNVPDYQKRLEDKLKSYGIPDGSFKMPQVDFYIECLPEATGEIDGEDSDRDTGRTILRVHIFDKQSTSHDTLQALLASTRNAEIEAITSARGTPRTSDEIKNNTGVDEYKKRNAAAILSKAAEEGLVEPNESTNPDLPTTYRIVGSPRQLKEFMMKTMPYIIYGAAGTTVKTANLSSLQDPRLATVNLLRSQEKSPLEPNGENPGGLPLRIIPTEVTVTSMGCPLINYAQQFFVDFQTGTTADSIYAVTGLTHSFTPGNFETVSKMTPLDGWGRYISLVQRLNQASEELKNAIQNKPLGELEQ